MRLLIFFTVYLLASRLRYIWHFYMWPVLTLTDPNSPEGIRLRIEHLQYKTGGKFWPEVTRRLKKSGIIKDEHGAGQSEVMFVIAIAAYFIFMGYLANASGYTAPAIGSLSDWSLPYVNTSFGWLTATIDFFISIMNIFAWVIGSLVSYVALIGFSVSGDIPTWMIAALFTPLALGMGWLVMSLIRGRE